jgi:hypothetical protein
MDRSRAHLALVTHLPARDWRWFGLRLLCRYCGQRYPCPPRQVALGHLADDNQDLPDTGRETRRSATARPP